MATESKKTKSFDRMDEAIIHCIEQNPKILLKQIPKALEEAIGQTLSYAKVQRRVNKLTAAGIVDRSYSIHWKKAGYLVRYRVGILIDPVALRDKTVTKKKYTSQKELVKYIMDKLLSEPPFSEQFKNHLVIDDVYILLGGKFDLAVDFMAKDDETATEFIIDVLRGLPGISNTVSAKMAYSSKRGWLSTERRRMRNSESIERA